MEFARFLTAPRRPAGGILAAALRANQSHKRLGATHTECDALWTFSANSPPLRGPQPLLYHPVNSPHLNLRQCSTSALGLAFVWGLGESIHTAWRVLRAAACPIPLIDDRRVYVECICSKT